MTEMTHSAEPDAGPTASQLRAAPVPRRLARADVLAALDEGWRDFAAMPSHNLLLAMLYPLMGVVAARAAQGADLIEMVFPLVAGFALVGPVASLGLLEISRRREMGAEARWSDGFAVAQSQSFWAILRVSMLLVALFLVWLAAARMIYAATVGDDAPRETLLFFVHVLSTPEGLALIGLGNLVGLGFAILAMAIGAFSLPLLLDGERSARRAVALSLAATAANPAAMALWGAIVGTLTLLSIICGVVGLAVALPVFAHGTWRLYRRVFPGGPIA